MTKVSSNEPLISVIIPVYKVEKYLNRCVDSVINQTYKNLEIILVDDGSPDNCPKICDEYAKKDKRIKVIHKKNAGVSLARNDGIDFCHGEWITFVDADDWIEYTYISDMLKIALENKVEYVCCGYNRVYDNKIESINDDLSVKKYNSYDYLNDILNVQLGYGFVHMKLLKKDVINVIRFNSNLKVGEDALFNVELCKNLNNIVVYNKALYNYRFNENSVVRKYDENFLNKYLFSMEKMNSYIFENYLGDKRIIQNLYNYIAYHVLLICVNYCFHPDNPENGITLMKKISKNNLLGESIKKSNYNNLSLSRKISLFVLKYKLYLLMSLICKIRQRQFRK